MRQTETTGAKFDYWEWYYSPDNPIRRYDEEHGIKLVRKPDEDGCHFVADYDIFISGHQIYNTFPTYFQTRRLDMFSTKIYSFGDNRDKALRAFNITQKYLENFNLILDQYGGSGLYYYSHERGTGKTFLSTILGNELTQRGHGVRWYGMTNLLQDIKAGFDKDSSTSSAEVIEHCRNSDVLILDDIGVERQSSWVNETMYSILDYRLSHCKPTIFTSNNKPHELSYDERIIDRITRMTTFIEMPEESIRKKLNAKNPVATFLGA